MSRARALVKYCMGKDILMNATNQEKLPFVIFQIKECSYAVSSQIVREILVMPQATAVPNASAEVRGVINLRGKIITLIDLRIKLGLAPLQTEMDALIQLLLQREEDHRKWLAELEACVREHRPFGLARDPHKCKFGLWYDQFVTKDRLLRMTLPAMDAPHKAIHATADQVLGMAERGDFDGALALISDRRNQELSTMIKLFAEARRILSEGHREVAVVLSNKNNWLAFSADIVEATEHIPEDRIEPMPLAEAGLGNGCNCRVARRPKTEQPVLIFGHEFFFASGTAGTAN
jgi:purine-binding chemotaxis protein CheW